MFKACVEAGVLYVPGEYCFQPDENGRIPEKPHAAQLRTSRSGRRLSPGIQRLAQRSTAKFSDSMSRTLFAYIFKDLIRIFMMASGALAGIMSFGGLLRPLTREGLDAGQVSRMLAYFGPAMTTYSFPIAALFATAVVYGRLSADNELTACKAGGISLLSITVSGPALVLGLVVAIASLLFLCFIVPFSTLKVERVIYSNLARLVQSRIERNHEIEFDQTTIFAQEAHVIPPDPASTPPGQQRVELIGPEIISTERTDPHDRTMQVPKEFYTASRAYVYIDPQPNGEEVNVIGEA